jgi:signal transduction histidine kinase
MPLVRETLPLGEVLERAVDLYHDVAESKGVSLTMHASPGALVSGDRVRLEQVAANLLDNAIKYTQPGGRVTASVRQADGRVELVVEDTGAGIQADELPRIWQRLFRGDRSRTERGLGLGLSFVKAIVEAHGGAVGVVSEPGRGSRFTIALPTP